MTNNLKQIREIYGATQSEIAMVVGTSRVTLAKWEKDTENRAPFAVLEKMSLFFGIGPECFYDIELDDKRKQMIVNTAQKAKEVDTNNKTSKEEHFKELFLNTTFDEAISRYMFAMKLLLALSDEGEVEDLKIVKQINEKMNNRLEMMISFKESKKEEESISDLMNKLSVDV